jgi:uncharacterized protein (TIGR00369 family)
MSDITPRTVTNSRIGEELGVEILERSEGRAVVRFPVEDRFKIPSGVLQGGMYAVMMDTAMAIAASGGLATATLQISLLRPATEGHVIVTGEIVRQGRSIIYLEAEVRDEEGRLLARGNQTGMVMPPHMPPAEAE